MRNHMLSIVPLVAGIILTIIGSLANNMVIHWFITIIGLMIIFWGLIIHSNNIKIIRNCRMNSKWGRNRP